MKYPLDTNVISEPMKARPNGGVVAWLSRLDEDEAWISVVTITELGYGIEGLATGKRRQIPWDSYTCFCTADTKVIPSSHPRFTQCSVSKTPAPLVHNTRGRTVCRYETQSVEEKGRRAARGRSIFSATVF